MLLPIACIAYLLSTKMTDEEKKKSAKKQASVLKTVHKMNLSLHHQQTSRRTQSKNKHSSATEWQFNG